MIGWHLHDQRIAHARRELDPEIWNGLAAVDGGDEHVPDDIVLVNGEVLRERTIDLDAEGWRMGRLEHVRVYDAGNLADVAGDFFGERIILIRVRAGNPYIDRRGQTEIQHLAGNVGGLEKECQLGKTPRQFAP